MKSWKALPLSLQILSVVLFLWAVMSIVALLTSPDRQIAVFGLLVSGAPAAVVIVLLDFVSPLLFLYALFKKLRWGANFGLLYNGIFILNNVVALFTVKDVLGNGIYFPLIASAIFFCVIFVERKHFA